MRDLTDQVGLSLFLPSFMISVFAGFNPYEFCMKLRAHRAE
jgi:hypothetical protein